MEFHFNSTIAWSIKEATRAMYQVVVCTIKRSTL